MSKTILKVTATLTTVTEIDSDLCDLDINPNWEDDAIKEYQELAEDELNESFKGFRQTASFDNFKLEVITE